MRSNSLRFLLTLPLILLIYFVSSSRASAADSNPISVQELGIYAEFIVPDRIQIYLRFDIQNTSDTVLETPQGEDPLVIFPIPEEALSIGFLPLDIILEPGYGNPFIKTSEGFGDPRTIAAGEEKTITYTFEMPYQKELILQIPIDYPVESISILENSNQSIHIKVEKEEVNGGNIVNLSISGSNPYPSPALIQPASQTEVIFGLVVLLVACVVLYQWYRKRNDIGD